MRQNHDLWKSILCIKDASCGVAHNSCHPWSPRQRSGSRASGGLDHRLVTAQIDRNLTPNAVTALRAGNADVLEKFTEHPLRQLELAKAYLESSEVTAHGPAMERVLDALAEEQIEAQRARHAAAHGEKGITHG